MAYTFDKTAQLSEAVKKGYKSQASRLRAQGVPTAQHNVNVTKTAAKKAVAKKSTAKKSTAKKTAAKKTTTKKS